MYEEREGEINLLVYMGKWWGLVSQAEILPEGRALSEHV